MSEHPVLDHRTDDQQENRLANILAERHKLTQQRLDIEKQLSAIITKLRISGRMSQHDYHMLCLQQETLKQQLRMNLRQALDIKAKLQEHARVKFCERRTEKNDAVRENATVDTPLRRELVQLRAHYMEFAADGTRVSSMRQMASEFAMKIDRLIKKSIHGEL